MGGGAKYDSDDDFSKSGPYHITSVDWTDSYHQTVVPSSLVNSVYVMQRDKAKKREKPLAKPWWDSFGFSLDKTLINEADKSIYGAVFKYDNYQNTSAELMAPSYVIAFRGTLLGLRTLDDLDQNLRCASENLSDGRRLQHAIQTIQDVLNEQGIEPTSVWLAGHSLGAGIALMAGKIMAKSGSPLKTYAFNPPNTSFPLEQVLEQVLDSNVLKGGLRFTNSLFRGTLSFVVSLFDPQIRRDDPRIAAWIPQLYVNPLDIICSEYIADFKHKNSMSSWGLGRIVRARDRISFRSLFFGGEGTLSSTEPVQRLSSADMIINRNKSTDSKTAHGPMKLLKRLWNAHKLKQWYEPDPVLPANWETKRIRRSM